MTLKHWLWSILWGLSPLLAPGSVGAAPLTIGIVLPQGQPLQNADAAESLRQSLITQLKDQSLETVPLTASSNDLADREAQAKRCNYVLYTHLQQGKSSNSISGGFAKMKAVLTGPGAFVVKPGDVTLEYRLIPVGSANPVKAESFSDKAGADGQIPPTLVAQLSGAVVAAAQSASSTGPAATSAGSASATAATAAAASATPVPSDASSSSGRSSPFGGLFGHRGASRSISPGGATNTNMACAQLASMPNAPMTREA